MAKDKREGHQADLDENAAVNKTQQADIDKARQADLDKNKAVNEAQQADLDKSKAEVTKTPHQHASAAANKARLEPTPDAPTSPRAPRGKDADVPTNKAKPGPGKPGKDAGQATNEAYLIDEAKPLGEQDAVASSPHGDNVNPNAYSAESARKLGNAATYSINEPPPGAPKPFKVPEDHTVTSAFTLAQDYPDGYVPPEPPEPEIQETVTIDDLQRGLEDVGNDPDDLEDEIDQAERDGDFKPMHPKSPSKKRK